MYLKHFCRLFTGISHLPKNHTSTSFRFLATTIWLPSEHTSKSYLVLHKENFAAYFPRNYFNFLKFFFLCKSVDIHCIYVYKIQGCYNTPFIILPKILILPTFQWLQTKTSCAYFIHFSIKLQLTLHKGSDFPFSVWQCFCAYECGYLVWLARRGQLVRCFMRQTPSLPSFLVGVKKEHTLPIQSQKL